MRRIQVGSRLLWRLLQLLALSLLVLQLGLETPRVLAVGLELKARIRRLLDRLQSRRARAHRTLLPPLAGPLHFSGGMAGRGGMGMHPGSMMQPQIVLLREGTDTSQGKAQLISNINACQAVVDVVRTTLGPRGMDKLIHDDKGQVTISNDGATLPVEHAAPAPTPVKAASPRRPKVTSHSTGHPLQGLPLLPNGG